MEILAVAAFAALTLVLIFVLSPGWLTLAAAGLAALWLCGHPH
jgi:hypothetical protein